MSVQKMEGTKCVDMKFIVFLKTTLGKMVSAHSLPNDFINLQFWQKWPRKFYNVRSYDSTKIGQVSNDDTGFGSDEDCVSNDQSEATAETNVNIITNNIYFLFFLFISYT